MAVWTAALGQAAPASAACSGRQLLVCSEKTQAFTDDVTWTHAFELDLELLEISAPLHLNNPALARFWRFETATAAARGFYEYAFGFQFGDPNFEAAATVPALSRPAVHGSGIVSRRLARALSRLMQAEQKEVLDQEALVISLNRATEASYFRGRQDWVSWQMSQAARYATRTANDISRVIAAQRGATTSLVRHKLLFGVGSADLRYAQRTVRRHGINPGVLSILNQFGLGQQASKFAREFESANFGQLSFSLSQFFSQPATISGERAFQTSLRHLAARVPAASQPPQ